MHRPRLFLSTTAFLAFLLGAGAPVLPSAWAQSAAAAGSSSGPAIDYHAKNRTLTVHLKGLPLNQVIEKLSAQTHIRFRPPDPAITFDSRPVTASFEQMPIERAIKQLLGPSNTAMLYGPSPASSQGEAPKLTEVRVIDLGVIPVVATTGSTNTRPSVLPANRLTPEQLQARREAIQKRLKERMEARQGRRGRRNFGATTQPSPDQSSGQSAEKGEKGSKPSDEGQSPTGASKNK